MQNNVVALRAPHGRELTRVEFTPFGLATFNGLPARRKKCVIDTILGVMAMSPEEAKASLPGASTYRSLFKFGAIIKRRFTILFWADFVSGILIILELIDRCIRNLAKWYGLPSVIDCNLEDMPGRPRVKFEIEGSGYIRGKAWSDEFVEHNGSRGPYAEFVITDRNFA